MAYLFSWSVFLIHQSHDLVRATAWTQMPSEITLAGRPQGTQWAGWIGRFITYAAVAFRPLHPPACAKVCFPHCSHALLSSARSGSQDRLCVGSVKFSLSGLYHRPVKIWQGIRKCPLPCALSHTEQGRVASLWTSNAGLMPTRSFPLQVMNSQ